MNKRAMEIFWNNWGKMRNVIFLYFIAVVDPGIGYSQEFPVLEKLYFISDEIVIIQIMNEQAHQQSAFNCSTYIDAKVVERLKGGSQSEFDSLLVHFIRPLESDKNANRSDAFLERENNLFVVFLKTNNPGLIVSPAKRTYYLADVSLGIQSFTKTLIGFIREIDAPKKISR